MVFGMKKKPDVNALAKRVVMLEQRFDSLVALLQDDCAVLRIRLGEPTIDGQPVPLEPPEEEEESAESKKKKELDEMRDIVRGKPSPTAKQVLRL